MRYLLNKKFGAFDLDRNIKVKMGVDTYERTVAVFEHTDDALSRPEAFPESARYGWCWAQEKVLSINARPGFFIKNNVVLPKGR